MKLHIILIIFVVCALTTNFACTSGANSTEDAEQYYAAAIDSIIQGDTNQAIQTMGKTYGIEPETADFYTRRAQFYDSVSGWDQAVADYENAISLQPRADLYYALAKSHINSNEFDQATPISYLDEAIRLNPEYADAYLLRGYTYQQWGLAEMSKVRTYESLSTEGIERYEKAIEDINEAIRLIPDGVYQAWRAVVYTDMGQYGEALADYDESIRLKPTIANYMNRGKYFYVLGKYKDALNDFNEMTLLNPQKVEAFLFRSLTYSELGSYREALLELNQAIALKPNYDMLYIYRSYMLIKLGDYDGAVYDYNRGIHGSPNLLEFSDEGSPSNAVLFYWPEIAKFPETLHFVQSALK